MERDEFASKTKETLAKRAGYRCSNPACNRPTVGPHSDPTKFVNLGVASHIVAAVPDGPRGNSQFSSDERKSINNGIWLCKLCSELIDKDESRFTIDLLNSWKHACEAKTEAELVQNVQSGSTNQLVLVSPAIRIGTVWHVKLNDESRVPCIHTITTNAQFDPCAFYSGVAYRFIIKPSDPEKTTILHGIFAEVISVEEIPDYRPLVGVAPAVYNVILVTFGDPRIARTNRFQATQHYLIKEGRSSERQVLHPQILDPLTPEILDCRLVPDHPGFYTIRILATISVDVMISEIELLPPIKILVLQSKD